MGCFSFNLIDQLRFNSKKMVTFNSSLAAFIFHSSVLMFYVIFQYLKFIFLRLLHCHLLLYYFITPGVGWEKDLLCIVNLCNAASRIKTKRTIMITLINFTTNSFFIICGTIVYICSGTT